MEGNAGTLLSKINSPEDLRKLRPEDLPVVCEELRQFIIDEVSTNPGHFGASLGVVELTVALHYIYNTPYDLLVWDVGHQAYSHKILTGRRDQFHTNRKYHGLSGFPKPSESEYDTFGVGHASTSISASLGMAVAASIQKDEQRKIVAVIGDGSMTGGMAFEGLNNAAVNNSDVLIILNDNNMAIDPNVGGVSNYLLNISRSKSYNRLKQEVWDGLGKLNGFGPKARRLVQKTEGALKSALLKESNLFESLGIRYFGPIDGHDIKYLTKVLQDLRDIPGPKLLHVLTKKGKGFKQAELNQTEFHAPGKFNKVTGELLDCECAMNKPPKFQNVFGNTLLELAEKNDKIVGVTPAMPTGSSLNIMMEKMPDRAFDVGIAEPHAVTFSAGMAIRGMVPFCNIYSTFMQRSYDQIIHDVAIQNLNVVFCLDRGGLVGADGPTHHGVFDIAYMRHIPNMIVSAPMDEIELRNLMYTAQQENMGPFSIRYPRGCGCQVDWRQPFESIPVGTGRVITEGNDLAILTFGTTGIQASRAVKSLTKDGHSVAHYDMRFVKPLDEKLLHQIFKKFTKVITIEDGTIQGGFGSAVLEFMADHQYTSKIVRLGVPDRFIEHGTPDELIRECGFDQKSIIQTTLDLLQG
ncbi:1-deoxy-D-xylulose-5-phosphate synthase [Mangrovibacterium diazotrophicum]|uniref:1-deoxy-D-xylulose-5-phosphate synthase n=1 Tax=Mangrovibacterium diazotrophicum TaxID=1261403 RepID=A0A419WAT6_9BACT|nr:1-deoxy-D-xylulose-5-phosphate synthase [Mangrovibacterium diazotrophicum]RKD92567.1 1-deoxy-D-xylulose-5-phosphate synthase [Mangrovibacterium diazotrophicum]